MTRVVAVVVTHDRRELLRECLAALTAQTHPLGSLVVVDNASSDGTADMVRGEFPHAELHRLERNAGGAGGFRAGVVAGLASGADWLWLLDDDTIAHSDALEQMLRVPWRESGLPEPSLLCSRVNWSDGEPHPMNTPILRRRDPDLMARAAAGGVLALRAATFVSLLVSARAVERHGPPRAEFFTQADDIDFTARVLREEHGYLVPGSVVEHQTPARHTYLSDPFRFRFHLRNTVFMLRGDAWATAEKPALAWVVVDSSLRFLRTNGIGAVPVVAGALRDGVRGSRGS